MKDDKYKDLIGTYITFVDFDNHGFVDISIILKIEKTDSNFPVYRIVLENGCRHLCYERYLNKMLEALKKQQFKNEFNSLLDF